MAVQYKLIVFRNLLGEPSTPGRRQVKIGDEIWEASYDSSIVRRWGKQAWRR